MGAKLNSLAVYCGSQHGVDPRFGEAARRLGTLLAEREITLVYGAGNVGLMGMVADACLGRGGQAVGVIPYGLSDKELAHDGLTELHVVDTMHERKAKMIERADGLVALPGGLGTLEEIAEAATWALLGIHRKPCGIWNVGGYYDHLLAFLDHAVTMGLLRPEHRRLIIVRDDIEQLLTEMEEYVPPAVVWRERGVVP